MKEFIEEYLKDHWKYFEEVSEFIYNHPETRFEEYESAEFLAIECEKQGFSVERNVADIETSFVATYGSGKPVIGFLGEYDALSGLGQKPNCLSYQPDGKENGHGCGHNLLGTGSFAAACAVKNYLEKNKLEGTVKFFGCAGEEGGSGKTFMVREGVFDNLDIALTWHPSPINAIMSLSSLANYQVYFRFKGTPSHAANSPHLGRSALDAVELMNVGVNYLREHVIEEARIHYAVTNTGGVSPNVVQADAEVLYLIRAPEISVVDNIFKRINKIAQGAALMTETELSVHFDKACSNYVPNRHLEQILYEKFVETGVEEFTEEEKSFAEKMWNTLTDEEKNNFLGMAKGFGYHGDGKEFRGKYLADTISTYVPSREILKGSTDVGDVSWVVPTAQLSSATSVLGTSLHSWQMTAQGLTSIANKGMLRAAQAMALTGLHILQSPEDLQKVKEEFEEFKKENPYTCPIPQDVKPSKLNKNKK
ncbi:M20 family metallopeptidase [Caldibacillus thermoamylovorans]|uniref:M20 family metallopeptidase n=1 Tax=Caldibacillus thermoamylovorans TaxID=35841 RepID=UPI0020422DE8|nr:M20 family metallopeptidase [Caldibacillus thermoamylovorans]MCM3479133.1 M20 family metallopeptidase [Caldibacillus thermoamylovorans]